MAKVKNTTTYPVTLSDGRSLGPGETADDVALGNAHNKALSEAGDITELNDAPAKAPKSGTDRVPKENA